MPLTSRSLAAHVALAVSLALAASPQATRAETPSAAKLAAVRTIDAHARDLVELSDRIWAFAEIALREHRSAALLADYAEQKGFYVERGVAGMPTAFVATFGQGRPIIGVMGEYDALPGVSQQAIAEKAPLEAGGAGHACGHNLFGAGSLGAALAIKEQIEAGTLQGTVRYFGTPAEEDIGGKIYMVRDGLFDDLDAVLAWHPADTTQADTTSSQAMVDLAIEFHGRSAHAAFDPWNGRSALDAAELFTHGINQMREHIRPSSRLHYTITAGGDVPNVIPEYARVWLWVRDWQRAEVESIVARVHKLAHGAAMMTETTAEVTVQGGSWEMLVNHAGARLLDENLRWLGPVAFSEEEQAFARTIQRATGVPELGLDVAIQPLEGQAMEGGSTDVADVSWVAPTLHVSVVTAPKDAPWHAWPVVATAGMSIGHKGMLMAAKTLAATMVDLYEQPALLAAVRAEFEATRGDVVYEAYVPDGPPPLPQDAPGAP
jgi:aminobenzoyl-glutamate utilization protein B